VTFNHGVEGSSPSALTKEIRYLTDKNRCAQKVSVCSVSAINCLPPRLAFRRLIYLDGMLRKLEFA
jgi:hypothetical protein